VCVLMGCVGSVFSMGKAVRWQCAFGMVCAFLEIVFKDSVSVLQ